MIPTEAARVFETTAIWQVFYSVVRKRSAAKKNVVSLSKLPSSTKMLRYGETKKVDYSFFTYSIPS